MPRLRVETLAVLYRLAAEKYGDAEPSALILLKIFTAPSPA
jgi:hypothetical protein